MVCMDLPQPKTGTQADLARFARLEKKARLMLNDQFEYAWKQRELAPEKHAAAFLTAWEVLCATAEVTCGLTCPADWVPLIGQDPAWAASFNDLMDNPKSLTRMYAKRFALLWPIYDVPAALSAGILQIQPDRRENAQSAYAAAGIPGTPACWHEHRAESPDLLPDWQHTLTAWQAVRRNLFQDPAWHNSENDYPIVSNAFLSLIYFFKESRLYFENPSLKPDIFDRTQVLSSL